jgi:hypothetical protein
MQMENEPPFVRAGKYKSSARDSFFIPEVE